MWSEAMTPPSSQQQPALRVQGLSKCFHLYDSPRQRLLQALWGRRKQLYREWWALREVSFELPRGESLGVVGRNGSGKSTLLQLICGTLTATAGTVQRAGRVGALLELGSGFNPEFSGRDNVFLNGALLGLSQAEMEQQLDAILSFADIGAFIDQPIKSYSSGMVVRLAFAVQAHVNPEILVVDEALAVGDELFQRKCYRRLEELRERGCSTLLVTHNCQLINQHCDRALLLHQGRMRLLDRPQRVTALYQQLADAEETEWEQTLGNAAAGDAQPAALSAPTPVIYPPRGIQITGVRVEDSTGSPSERVPFDGGFQLRFEYRADKSLNNLRCGCHIADPSGRRYTGQIFPGAEQGSGAVIPLVEPGQQWQIVFRFRHGLLPGIYFVGGGVWSDDDERHYLHRVVDMAAFRIVAHDGILRVGTCDLTAGPPLLLAVGSPGGLGC